MYNVEARFPSQKESDNDNKNVDVADNSNNNANNGSEKRQVYAHPKGGYYYEENGRFLRCDRDGREIKKG